jgi:hypothetical protein
LNGEADLIGFAPDDFDGDGCGGSDGVAGIAAIGEDLFDKREGAPRCAQHRSRAITILDASLMRFKDETATIGIDKRVTRKRQLDPVFR